MKVDRKFISETVAFTLKNSAITNQPYHEILIDGCNARSSKAIQALEFPPAYATKARK